MYPTKQNGTDYCIVAKMGYLIFGILRVRVLCLNMAHLVVHTARLMGTIFVNTVVIEILILMRSNLK